MGTHERRMPPSVVAEPDRDACLSALLAHLEATGLRLYPAQEDAILALFSDEHVVLETPTGSGKSLVALAAHVLALSQRYRSIYTAPLKALVNEKFFDLCERLGAEHVGLVTGDARINADAPVLCCTAEILANWCADPARVARVGSVVMDEFHFYGDRDRGVAWQIPLLTLPGVRFLLMSATLGDIADIKADVEARTGRSVTCVRSQERPVPLDFAYSEAPRHEVLATLLKESRLPAYFVFFSQRAATEQAESFASIDLLSTEDKRRVRELMQPMHFKSPLGPKLKRLLSLGIGVHHAGLLPRYRHYVEVLANSGMIRVVAGTDTLGVGVNLPIRTVVLTQLCKFDGEKTRLISARLFHQLAGRAGRKGFDVRGSVLVQAPEHVIENKLAQSKAAENPKKLKKLQLKKPPEFGFVPWDSATFERLTQAAPEPLTSRFRLDHGLVLRWLEGQGGQASALCKLIDASHGSRFTKFRQKHYAVRLVRELIESDVVARTEPAEGAPALRVNAELQDDFSVSHSLGIFALSVLEGMDRQAPNYALDAVSVIEAILETPEFILRQQRGRARQRRLAELKAEGVDYDERQALLEEVDAPRPLADVLVPALDAFRLKAPWIDVDALVPKSIGRELLEDGISFNQFVSRYGLERAEGVLLRYLFDLWRTLQRSVPDAWKTDELLAYELELKTLIARVDNTLETSWKELAQAEHQPVAATATSDRPPTLQDRIWRLAVENACWRAHAAFASGDYTAFSAEWNGSALDECTFVALRERFLSEHDAVELSPRSRALRWLVLEAVPADGLELPAEVPDAFRTPEMLGRRRLCDTDAFDDWEFVFGARLVTRASAVEANSVPHEPLPVPDREHSSSLEVELVLLALGPLDELQASVQAWQGLA